MASETTNIEPSTADLPVQVDVTSSGNGNTTPDREAKSETDLEREALQDEASSMEATIDQATSGGGRTTTAIRATIPRRRQVLKFLPSRPSRGGASGMAPTSQTTLPGVVSISPAVAEEGTSSFLVDAANVSPPESEANISSPAPEQTTSAFLVEASLVAEDPPEPVFLEEEPIYFAEEPHSALETIIVFLRTSRGILLCLGFALIIAGGIVASVLCAEGLCASSPDTYNQAVSNGTSTEAPSTATALRPTYTPTVAPTSEPSSDEMLLLDLLPNYTVTSLRDPFTAQSRAFSWVENHPFLQSLPEWRIQELFAMATFYYAFNGNNWVASGQTNYLSYSEPICNWGGAIARCFGDGRLQSLTLGGDISSSMQLDGSMPPEIAMLSSLERIQISYTDSKIALEDMIPTEMGLMTSLQHLEFISSVHGTFPAFITMLSSLKTLSVTHNSNLNGTPPTDLGRLTALEELYLARNQLKGTIPSQIASLASLKRLFLEVNQLSGPLPTELGLLTSLDILYLHGNKINGTLPTYLGLMNNLRNLCLVGNEVSGQIPTEFGLLSSLQIMQLNGNNFSGTVADEVCALGLNYFQMLCDTATCPEGCGCTCCGIDDPCDVFWL